jgi:hypothetical protein
MNSARLSITMGIVAIVFVFSPVWRKAIWFAKAAIEANQTMPAK